MKSKMEVEIGRVNAGVTPASVVAQYVAKRVAELMSVTGIESISAHKYECGFGSRLHVTVSAFQSAPKEISDQGIVIKDALAQILSIANVARLQLKPFEEDRREMEAMWKDMTGATASSVYGTPEDLDGGQAGDSEVELPVPAEHGEEKQ